MHLQYFQICRDCLNEFKDLEVKIEKLNESSDEKHIVEMNRSAMSTRIERTAIIGIVFGALCMEAFIFDYGATRISKSYMTNHIDKIDTPSKFVVVTKLVTGKDFPTDSQAYEGLKRLVKDRNKLVHFKGGKKIEVDLESQYSMDDFLKGALINAFETVLAVAEEVDTIHDKNSQYYSNFINFDQCHA